MAGLNHTLDEERKSRVVDALSVANDLAECVHYVADLFHGAPHLQGIALTATLHLTRLMCWHLDVAQRELEPGAGSGSFESELSALVR